jgi:hypothetical protein
MNSVVFKRFYDTLGGISSLDYYWATMVIAFVGPRSFPATASISIIK